VPFTALLRILTVAVLVPRATNLPGLKVTVKVELDSGVRV
jgi:hypothetical protein